MKVAIVGPFNEKLCGVKRYSVRLCKYLEKIGVKVTKVPSDKSFTFSFNLLRELEKIAPDIVHVQHEFGLYRRLLFVTGMGIAPFYALPKGSFKVVTTLHEVKTPNQLEKTYIGHPNPLNKVRFYRRLKCELMNRVSIEPVLKYSYVIIVHASNAKKGINEMGYENVILVPHGTDIMPPRKKQKEFDFLSLGQLSYDRRYDVVFDALKGLKVKYLIHTSKYVPKAAFKWLYHLKRIAPRNIEFLDKPLTEKELLDLISSTRAVIIPPSREEKSGSGVFHDALSLGKAVIAPNIGEYRDFKDHILLYSNMRELRGAVLQLLDEENLEYYSKASEALARRTSWDSIAKVHLEIYNRCLDGRKI